MYSFLGLYRLLTLRLYRLTFTFMMFDKKFKKYWNTFGVIVALLVIVSMVLLYAAPSLSR